MKLSEITISEVISYLRLDSYDPFTLEPILTTAKKFIQSYTGLDEREADEHEDFFIVVMILCQDMHDNRVLYVDKNNLNKVVSTILDIHRKNLI